MKLALITVSAAIRFTRSVHRRLPRVQGGMWAVAVEDDGAIIGVAIVGHPARVWMGDTLCVLRVAVVEGHYNACSMLYGACSRAAKALGAANLVTYTHLDENGASVKAANWIDGGLIGAGDWDRPSRQRDLPIDAERKRRWFAPWSRRVSHG